MPEGNIRSHEALHNWSRLANAALRPVTMTMLEAIEAPTLRRWRGALHANNLDGEMVTAVLNAHRRLVVEKLEAAAAAAHPRPLSQMTVAELRSEAMLLGFDITVENLRTRLQFQETLRSTRPAERQSETPDFSKMLKPDLIIHSRNRGIDSHCLTCDRMRLALQNWTHRPRCMRRCRMWGSYDCGRDDVIDGSEFYDGAAAACARDGAYAGADGSARTEDATDDENRGRLHQGRTPEAALVPRSSRPAHHEAEPRGPEPLSGLRHVSDLQGDHATMEGASAGLSSSPRAFGVGHRQGASGVLATDDRPAAGGECGQRPRPSRSSTGNAGGRVGTHAACDQRGSADACPMPSPPPPFAAAAQNASMPRAQMMPMAGAPMAPGHHYVVPT